jgi:XTP/dITP diphosphohydrolase
MNKIIVLVTTNQQKLKQMKFALKPLESKYQFVALNDIHYQKEIIENKRTFKGNSLLKAKQVCKDTGFITIAEDSGLCIDALNGAPGIHTHRFAGIKATRKQQLSKVLNKIKEIKHPYRTAYFISVVTCY